MLSPVQISSPRGLRGAAGPGVPQARSGGTWGHGGHSPKSFFCILEAVGAVAGEGQRGQSWGNTRLAGAGSSRHRALHRNPRVGALGRALWGVLCPQKGLGSWQLRANVRGSCWIRKSGCLGAECGFLLGCDRGAGAHLEAGRAKMRRNPPSPRDVAEISECCGRIQLPSWEVASGEGSSVSWPWLHWLQVPLAIPTARPGEHPGARLH